MHAHGHGHDHGAHDTGAGRLAVALALVALLVGVELVGGLLANSLALLADAAHMLGDAGSLGLALFAIWIGRRPPSHARTFGLRRAEILAALANGVALVAIAIWIFVEAVQRLGDPVEPEGGLMLAVGALGLAANVAAAAVLMRGERSLNVEAALRHVLADLAGSLGVIVAALAVVLTGWHYADPLVGIALAVLVLASSWTILRDSVNVLLEAAPAGVDTETVGRAMVAVEGVQEVHDLHVWTITSGFAALSAHVLVEPGADCHALRERLEHELGRRFGLTHTTLQVEHGQGLVQIAR